MILSVDPAPIEDRDFEGEYIAEYGPDDAATYHYSNEPGSDGEFHDENTPASQATWGSTPEYIEGDENWMIVQTSTVSRMPGQELTVIDGVPNSWNLAVVLPEPSDEIRALQRSSEARREGEKIEKRKRERSPGHRYNLRPRKKVCRRW